MSAPQQKQSMMRYASLATQWMVMLLLAVGAGYELDKWLHWRIPVFLILFPLIALGASLWQIITEFTKPKK